MPPRHEKKRSGAVTAQGISTPVVAHLTPAGAPVSPSSTPEEVKDNKSRPKVEDGHALTLLLSSGTACFLLPLGRASAHTADILESPCGIEIVGVSDSPPLWGKSF